jgi:hypothetical protein
MKPFKSQLPLMVRQPITEPKSDMCNSLSVSQPLSPTPKSRAILKTPLLSPIQELSPNGKENKAMVPAPPPSVQPPPLATSTFKFKVPSRPSLRNLFQTKSEASKKSIVGPKRVEFKAPTKLPARTLAPIAKGATINSQLVAKKVY